MAQYMRKGLFLRAMQWIRAVVFFAGAMACASMHRVTFSVLAIPIREEFGLSLPQMGVLQSAVLAGYILGQVTAVVISPVFLGSPGAPSIFAWDMVPRTLSRCSCAVWPCL